MDADRRPDLVATRSRGGSVLRGNGDGNFVRAFDFPVRHDAPSVEAADVDADGRPDVIVTNVISNTVSILLGTPGGGLGSRVDLGTGSSPLAPAIADLDGDGRRTSACPTRPPTRSPS